MSEREPCVYLSVDRDRLTGGIQLSIDDENGGYRIAGPKYCGMSVSLIEHRLNERDIAELSSYLRKAKRLLKRAATAPRDDAMESLPLRAKASAHPSRDS